MADPKIEDRSDEMERDLHQLEDHIDDAEKRLEARRDEAGAAEGVAGNWEGEQDRGNGDDPVGAKQDAETGGARGNDGRQDDGREPEEAASPT
jgi:hypothetical protein